MNNALILINPEDHRFIGFLKPMLSSIPNNFVITEEVKYLIQLTQYCKQRKVNRVISTSADLLWKLLEKDWPVGMRSRPKIGDYAGSIFDLPGIPNGEILFINPLKQLVTVPTAKFTCARFISKLTEPEKWHEPTEFVFQVCDRPDKQEKAYEILSRAIAIGTDIETIRAGTSISCSGYTGLFMGDAGNLYTRTFVIPLVDLYSLGVIRRINRLPIPKIFQNGKYDNAYFLRFGAPVINWMWDTQHLFHAWYSELPKDLGFLNAFFLRKVQYWKDLAKAGDKYLYYKYNGLDSWATVNVWLIQMLQMPDWARRNYELEFPLVFPCLLSEMTGVKRDMDALTSIESIERAKLDAKQKSLNKMLGCTKDFNVLSRIHMAALFKVLGLESLGKKWKEGEEKDSFDEIILNKARLEHPIAGRILDLILEIRGIRKNLSTYLTIGEKAKEFHGRLLYNLNPHGTDTGRCSSNEHHFWCGLNFQTAPVERQEYKKTIASDPGFSFAECDLKQAESWDVAYISGSSELREALVSGRDFHAVNASRFFGIPYDKIYSDEFKKTIDKKLRDLSKRTNHGATYVMGAQVLCDTMGLDKIYEARKLLNLPTGWSAIQIAEYLLSRYHKAYPTISSVYYPYVMNTVLETQMLVSRAMHHVNRTQGLDSSRYICDGDWTRYCFGRPDKNKHNFNSLVAHGPQSLNARTLNEAYLRIFYRCALLNPEFRLPAQIHDSALYQFKDGMHEKYHRMVKECMEIPVTIRGCDGVTRTFTVPADIKAGKDGRGAKFWSMTE